MAATHFPARDSNAKGLGNRPHPTFVVGIGASAGGIEPLETFFSGMPDDSGAAFVIVQHLAAHFDSLMDEILARRTGMAIRKVEDVLPIEANTIYLLAQGKNILIQDGMLRAIDPPTDSFPIYPIDRFFQSLAREWGAKSIAIVLSGTGTDGNRGIEAVHQDGGTILVQDPKSAQFDGMPIQAISTNCVDLVLPPDRLASTVYQLVTGGSIQILEGTAVMLLTVPILLPVVVAAGIDPIWFGIFVIIVSGAGLIHPPLGLLLFVVKSMLPDVRMNEVAWGVVPYLGTELLLVGMLIAFPGIVMLLPNLMP